MYKLVSTALITGNVVANDVFLFDIDGCPDDHPEVAVEVLARVVDARVLLNKQKWIDRYRYTDRFREIYIDRYDPYVFLMYLYEYVIL